MVRITASSAGRTRRWSARPTTAGSVLRNLRHTRHKEPRRLRTLLQRTRHSPRSIATTGRPPGGPSRCRSASVRAWPMPRRCEPSSPTWSGLAVLPRAHGRARSLDDVPFPTKAELRASQAAGPPFGAHLCAPRRGARAHARDLGDDRRAGGDRPDARATTRPTRPSAARRSRSPACAASDVIAHCLNYALYAGGIADHMALEAIGRDGRAGRRRPVRAAARPHPKLGITAIYRHAVLPRPPGRARARGGARPGEELGLRHIVTAGRARRRAGARARADRGRCGGPRWPTRSA